MKPLQYGLSPAEKAALIASRTISFPKPRPPADPQKAARGEKMKAWWRDHKGGKHSIKPPGSAASGINTFWNEEFNRFRAARVLKDFVLSP